MKGQLTLTEFATLSTLSFTAANLAVSLGVTITSKDAQATPMDPLPEHTEHVIPMGDYTPTIEPVIEPQAIEPTPQQLLTNVVIAYYGKRDANGYQTPLTYWEGRTVDEIPEFEDNVANLVNITYEACAQYQPTNEDCPTYMLAVMMQESQVNPTLDVGKGYGGGVMMLVVSTAKGLGLTDKERFQPEAAIPAGTNYDAQMQQQFGNRQLANYAYMWGPGNVRKWIRNGKQQKQLDPAAKKHHNKIERYHHILKTNLAET